MEKMKALIYHGDYLFRGGRAYRPTSYLSF